MNERTSVRLELGVAPASQSASGRGPSVAISDFPAEILIFTFTVPAEACVISWAMRERRGGRASASEGPALAWRVIAMGTAAEVVDLERGRAVGLGAEMALLECWVCGNDDSIFRRISSKCSGLGGVVKSRSRVFVHQTPASTARTSEMTAGIGTRTAGGWRGLWLPESGIYATSFKQNAPTGRAGGAFRGNLWSVA